MASSSSSSSSLSSTINQFESATAFATSSTSFSSSDKNCLNHALLSIDAHSNDFQTNTSLQQFYSSASSSISSSAAAAAASTINATIPPYQQQQHEMSNSISTKIRRQRQTNHTKAISVNATDLTHRNEIESTNVAQYQSQEYHHHQQLHLQQNFVRCLAKSPELLVSDARGNLQKYDSAITELKSAVQQQQHSTQMSYLQNECQQMSMSSTKKTAIEQQFRKFEDIQKNGNNLTTNDTCDGDDDIGNKNDIFGQIQLRKLTKKPEDLMTSKQQLMEQKEMLSNQQQQQQQVILIICLFFLFFFSFWNFPFDSI